MEIERYSFGPYGPFVSLKDHEQALAEKDLALSQANRHKEELFQKLAEKDREIASMKHEYAQLKEAYQQLMAQAVDWASYIMTIDDETWETYKNAKRFLASQEVQAWKEQQK